MTGTDRNTDGHSATQVDDTSPQGLNPRDTDHPTGSHQAEENENDESPS